MSPDASYQRPFIIYFVEKKLQIVLFYECELVMWATYYCHPMLCWHLKIEEGGLSYNSFLSKLIKKLVSWFQYISVVIILLYLFWNMVYCKTQNADAVMHNMIFFQPIPITDIYQPVPVK